MASLSHNASQIYLGWCCPCSDQILHTSQMPLENFQTCTNFPNLLLEPGSRAVMVVSAVWICLHRLMVVGTTPAERGEWKRAGPLLYGVSLHQHPQTGPGTFQTGPSILQKPKERVNSSNLCQMPCKKCEQDQGGQRRKKVLLIQPETGRTHHYSRANCILDMCTHNLCT